MMSMSLFFSSFDLSSFPLDTAFLVHFSFPSSDQTLFNFLVGLKMFSSFSVFPCYDGNTYVGVFHLSRKVSLIMGEMALFKGLGSIGAMVISITSDTYSLGLYSQVLVFDLVDFNHSFIFYNMELNNILLALEHSNIFFNNFYIKVVGWKSGASLHDFFSPYFHLLNWGVEVLNGDSVSYVFSLKGGLSPKQFSSLLELALKGCCLDYEGGVVDNLSLTLNEALKGVDNSHIYCFGVSLDKLLKLAGL